MFSDLGEVGLRRLHPMSRSSTVPSGSPAPYALCLRGPPSGRHASAVVVGLTPVGTLVGDASPWPGWLPGSALCRGYRPTGGRIPAQLPPGPRPLHEHPLSRKETPSPLRMRGSRAVGRGRAERLQRLIHLTGHPGDEISEME